MSLKLVIWNVEHGNAISIITPNGKRIIQDLGANSKKSFSPTEYSINRYKKRQVDALIVTHPHRDHIDDILCFKRSDLHKEIKHFVRPMKIGEGYFKEFILSKGKENLSENNLEKYNAYFEFHKTFPNTYISKSSPLNPDNNGGVEFQFFKPNKSNLNNINNHSIVTIIKYNDKKIMLTGDNEGPSWKELLAQKKFRDSIQDVDIFLASHHGRENGYHKELFDYFSPKLVLISDGPSTNTNAISKYYRHVSEPFNVCFKKQGRSKKRCCLTTRNDNAIILTINNKGLEVKTSS
jgi:competence protein ComEC